jgi:hypothetical protein
VENSVTFDPSLDYGATFRFPVTWSYVSGAPNLAQPAPAQAIPKPVKPVAVRAESSPTMEVATTRSNQALKAAGPAPSGPDAKWEMVIPKMTRPVAARPQRSLERTTERAAPSPPAPPSPETASAETPTEISFYAGSEASFVPRRWKMLSLCAAVVVVGCVIAWVRPTGKSATVTESSDIAAGTWSRRTAYLVGGTVPREILIYSGSEEVKNYRIEFAWVPDTRGVGWIFRGTDSANYYAAKVRLIQPGATPSLSAEHFTVVKGVEGTHSRRVITLGQNPGQVLVRMDANGPAFTLYLQGNPADYWTDERFETGSLGFYAERGERPVLQALRFTFFKKSGLQTVVTSLQ